MKPQILPLVLALAAPLAAASPADCLVGRWEPDGNGAAEWVQRQAPGMQMAIQQQAAELELRADGSYSAWAQVQAQAGAGGSGLHGSSRAQLTARGRWSADAGTLTLVPDASASQASGSLEVGNGRGLAQKLKLPQLRPQASSQQYSCSGQLLETRTQIRGVADPVVQRYRRK